MPPDPLVVVATFEIRDGHEETFKAALLELGVEACLAFEPACITLWAHQDTDDPTRFMLYEHWTDRPSFEASFASPWRQTYMDATESLWASPRVTTIWELLTPMADVS